MSLQIIKPGLLDTIQDLGRKGYRHLGIGASGAADYQAASLANCLLGKSIDKPVIEMHFPAATIRFNAATIICLTGANFSAEVEGISCRLNQPVAVAAGSVLNFTRPVKGARCYLALLHDLELDTWLGSYSTNLVACAGGMDGKKLEKNVKFGFSNTLHVNTILLDRSVKYLPWRVETGDNDKETVRILQGAAWNHLKYDAQKAILNNSFVVTAMSDRMGLQLKGDVLHMKEKTEILSTAVTFGTIQLLPNGQMIILQADHQTTGGYAQVAHVISADWPVLAQKTPDSAIRFTFTDQHTADILLVNQKRYFRELRSSCDIQIQHLLHA